MKGQKVLSIYPHLPTGVTLILGLGLTAIATLWVGRWEQLTRQSQFQTQIDNLTTSLQRTTNRYSDLLLSVGDFYRATDAPITEAGFSQFVQRALGSYPGIQALEWAPLVLHSQRPAYEQALSQRYQGQFTSITERWESGEIGVAGVSDRYVPVTFVEPWQGNEAALGYDLTSDATRRVALERSRDTGQLAATGRIQLVQETIENQYSFLMFLPVYRQPADTPTERRQQLEGYILGVFRVSDVVEESLQGLSYDIDFYLFDQTARPDQQFLGFYDATTQKLTTQANQDIQRRLGRGSLCPTGDACGQRINLGQREWRILFLPAAAYQRYWLPWGTLGTALVGLLLTFSLWVYLSRWQSELARTRELSDLKLRLFSMTSHELRTPLSTIMVSAQSLSTDYREISAEQQARSLERIQTAARRLGQLVSDILTLARAEAGKLDYAPELFALEPFCQQLVEDVRLSLKPEQSMVFTPQRPLPPAYLDKALVHSMLFNLLTNASKYSPAASTIQLRVRATPTTFELAVVDQGMGIPADTQDQIFEAFYRGTNVGTIQGTGLGLAIVKTCVDLHQGQVTVHSSTAGGTTIAITLPRIE